MLLKVEKMNDNLAVKIPSDFAKKCGFDSGCQVNMRLHNNRIIIESTDQSFSSIMTFWNEVNEEEAHSEMYFG